MGKKLRMDCWGGVVTFKGWKEMYPAEEYSISQKESWLAVAIRKKEKKDTEEMRSYKREPERCKEKRWPLYPGFNFSDKEQEG